jgi:hypothetical protein
MRKILELGEVRDDHFHTDQTPTLVHGSNCARLLRQQFVFMKCSPITFFAELLGPGYP